MAQMANLSISCMIRIEPQGGDVSQCPVPSRSPWETPEGKTAKKNLELGPPEWFHEGN